jgi:alpha-ketoglutarate-dependent taurine dioxygenase
MYGSDGIIPLVYDEPIGGQIMAVFGYLESHQERWTISDSEASARTPRSPERSAFGHLARLSSEVLGAESQRILFNGDETGIDVIIVAQPERPFAPGSPSAGHDEAEALLTFVRDGGGLFIMVGQSAAEAESIGMRLAECCGIKVTRERLFSVADDDCILSGTVICDDIKPHPAALGVRQVICRCGVGLECDEESQEIVSTPAGKTVLAVSSYGSGRVAVIGSSELFALPYVGAADNAVLCMSVLAWLAGGVAEGAADQVGNLGRADLVCRTIRDKEYSPRVPGRTLPAPVASVPALLVRAEEAELRSLYCTSLDPYARTDDFLAHAELAYHRLPEFVRRTVREFRDESNDCGALLIRGLPSDADLPPTPAEPATLPVRKTYMSEFWLAVFSSALGDQVGYAQESAGALFQNVVPTRANAANLSSQSSQVLLGLHTEIAFHPAMPDYVLLYCLRPARDRDAMTLVAGARRMVSLLPPRHRVTLFRQVFRTGVDYSYGSPNGRAGNGPLVSVLHGDPFDPLMRLDPDLMLGEDAEARAALTAIGAVSQSCEVSVPLDSADLLLIDNRRAVHGRSPFGTYYDGSDRWLQRSLVLRDLTRFSAERADGRRVIGTMFAV